MTSPQRHMFSIFLLALVTSVTAAEDGSLIPAYHTDRGDQGNYFSTLPFLEEFVGVIEIPGDCNGDGLVNGDDLQCACESGSLDTVLTVTGLEAGDLDGNGEVGFSDFLTLSANFGLEVPGYPDGDIDCDGTVGFPDFLALSANFGTTGGAAAASVPEPSSSLLACLASLALLRVRKNRNQR